MGTEPSVLVRATCARMGRLHRWGVLASLLVIVGISACGGEDPDVVLVPGPDASTSGGDGGDSGADRDATTSNS